MNRQELRARLSLARIPEIEYNLAGVGPTDDKYVMEQTDGKWHVYYSERGSQYQSQFFDTEDQACDYLLHRFIAPGEENVIQPFPLGSVVRLRGGSMKLMIISRALRVPGKDGKQYFFDYGAVAYPNGLITTDMAYFQRESVEEVYHWGYSDEDDQRFLDSIQYYLDTHPETVRGNPETMGE